MGTHFRYLLLLLLAHDAVTTTLNGHCAARVLCGGPGKYTPACAVYQHVQCVSMCSVSACAVYQHVQLNERKCEQIEGQTVVIRQWQ